MSSQLVSKDLINSALEDRFDSTTPSIYKTVLVLLLYWKESDAAFKKEANDVSTLFKDTFNYVVIPFEIPAQNSHLELSEEISRFVRNHSTPRSLIIIHYGGHGDRDENRKEGEAKPPRKGVWAARSDEECKELVNWSAIQPTLQFGKGDFLVILDCCFGAQAARAPEQRIIPQNVELLAAAPMGCMTAGPGDHSFTCAFIAELRNAVAKDGSVAISDIHHRLVAGDQKLLQTPVLFSHGTRRTICLEPLPAANHVTTSTIAPETILVMRMMIRSPLDHDLLDRVMGWLSNYVPHEVYGIQVTELIHRASTAQDFVLRGSSSKQQSVLQLESLPNPSKAEVKKAWSIFNWGLQDSLKAFMALGGGSDESNSELASSTTASTTGNTVEKEKVKDFLRTFDENIELLERVIERNILAAPELFEEISLKHFIEESTTKNPALVKSLQLRLENLRFEEKLRNASSDIPNSVVPQADPQMFYNTPLKCEEHPRHGRVLVEYSGYGKVDEETQSRNELRMDHLVKILRSSESGFRTPNCVEWSTKEERCTYSLIFQNPFGATYTPVTLHELLGPQRNDGLAGAAPRPTLGQRFILAKALGDTILKWHTVGWVHESISSLNVVFFLNTTTNTLDYSKFYLFGFSFSRLTSHYSTPRLRGEAIFRDLYQHPERQGFNLMERHTKEHDLYSFGVLLFEIGFWSRVADLFSKLVKEKRPDQAQEKMLRRIEHLGREMGTGYASAARVCLEKEWGIEMDDKAQSQLARKFEYDVIRKMEAGTKLDG